MEIRSINGLKRLNTKKKIRQLSFSFPELSDNENQAWEEKILRDYYTNGDDALATLMLAMSVTIIAYTVYRKFFAHTFTDSLELVLNTIVLVFVAIGVTKTFGLLRIKLRFRKNMEELMGVLSNKN